MCKNMRKSSTMTGGECLGCVWCVLERLMGRFVAGVLGFPCLVGTFPMHSNLTGAIQLSTNK